jgi:Tfp pilus assembly protein PilO
MSDIRKLSAGAVVLILAVLAGGWFLLVAPKHHSTSALESQATSQESKNASLLQQLQVLQAQQQDLPQQEAKLADLRTRIPNNPALPTLIRDLTAAATKVGISLDSLAPAAPVSVVAAPEAVTAAPSTAGAAAAAPALFQVPLTLKVTGSYFAIEQYLNRLEGLKRSLMVTGFTLTPGAGDTTSATATAATGSDLTVTLTGRVFLSQAAAPTTSTPIAPAATASGS